MMLRPCVTPCFTMCLCGKALRERVKGGANGAEGW